jgi:hypothetical protein
MLGKKEAADYLGMSTRTLERYVNDGRLSVRYEESANGQIALFDPEELDQLKEQKQIPRIKPAVIGSELAPTSSDINLSGNVGGLFTPFQRLIERLILALNTRDDFRQKITPAQLQGKLLLKISEVQVLTGLSREFLIESIKDESLKAQIIGKAYRVKFKDLERFIDEL